MGYQHWSYETLHALCMEAFEKFGFTEAEALANLISDDELSADYIIPKAFDPRVGLAVARAVADAAKRSGVARIS